MAFEGMNVSIKIISASRGEAPEGAHHSGGGCGWLHRPFALRPRDVPVDPSDI